MNSPLTFKQRFKLSRFIRGEPASSHAITLSHRRIFILPTLRGLMFMAFIGLLVMLAFVYNNNLAYLLGFLLASIFLVSTLHSYKALAGLVVSSGKNNAVFAGESAAFAILINNPASYQRSSLQLMADATTTLQIDLMHQTDTIVALLAPTQKRGHKLLGAVTFVSYFPLGIFKAWSPVNFPGGVLVYPKPANSRLPLPETYTPKHQVGQIKVGSDEFYQCQNYQPGDPIRQIHWKAYAKQQGLLSKKYSGETSAEIWLDLSVTPGQGIESKLSQLCRWILDAQADKLSYGLRIPGINYPPQNSHGHMVKCLEALALFET